MKFSKIALACSLALVAMSSHAGSVTVPAGTKTIYIAGASAPDRFLTRVVTTMFQPGTVITMANAASQPTYRAYLGKSNEVPGITNGTDLLIIKRSAGGSVRGVNPVARGERIKTMSIDSCAVNPVAGEFAHICPTLVGLDPNEAGFATTANLGMVPDIGISDVEPAMFQAPFNVEQGSTALTAAEAARLTVDPLNALMMGIVATDKVSTTHHISRSNYGSMLSGDLPTWQQIDGTTDRVVVCRRFNGSGTQLSYNWFFSGFPCAKANGHTNLAPATTPTPANSTLQNSALPNSSTNRFVVSNPGAGVTARILELSSSTNVRACLTAANAGNVFDYTDAQGRFWRVNFNTPQNATAGPGYKAIGTLSLDSYSDMNASSGFKFRMLDGAGTYDPATQTASAGATGIAPSKDNLVNGRYDFVVEVSSQVRNVDVTNTQGDVLPAIAGATNLDSQLKEKFWNEFVRRAGSSQYTGDTTGAFTTVPNAFATLPSIESYNANPTLVSKYTRRGNTCQMLERRPSI